MLFHVPGVDQDAVEVWSITTPDGGAGAAAWMDQVGQPWGRNGDMVVGKVWMTSWSHTQDEAFGVADWWQSIWCLFLIWLLAVWFRWRQQMKTAAWLNALNARAMHQQCTTKPEPWHNAWADHTNHMYTQNHRHHAIHSTHLRNSTPFGNTSILWTRSVACHAWRPKTRGPWDSGIDSPGEDSPCSHRCPQVQRHKVQEVVQIYQAFLRNIRVSRESWFGPGVNLRFWEKFSKRFLKPPNNLETKEMWRGASICQSSNTTSTQACFSEVPQEELPFTFLAMFYSPLALYSASLSRFLPANIHHSTYACIYTIIEMSTYYILYTIPPTGKPVFCCTAPRHTSTTKHSTDCWQADMYACAVVPSWLS